MYGLRVLVVEGNAADREQLRFLLSQRVDVAKVQEAENRPAAHDHLKHEAMDVAFVGVDSSDAETFPLSGDSSGAPLPPTVFVGSDGSHAVEALDGGAIDYLVKPISPRRVDLALRRVRAAVGTSVAGEPHVTGLTKSPVHEPTFSDRLVVKVGGRFVFERVPNVSRVDAEGNYVRVYVGGRTYVLRKTMAEIEASLDPATFLRVHRSAMVNVNFIRAIEPLYNGEFSIVLEDGGKVATGRLFRHRIRDLLQNSA